MPIKDVAAAATAMAAVVAASMARRSGRDDSGVMTTFLEVVAAKPT
jgi:hypothetical protein